MEVKVMKKCFSYSQNGTGNRLVFYFQGCDMHCPWCSNPECLAPEGTLLVHHPKLPKEICPKGHVHKGKLDRIECGSCTTRECLSYTGNVRITFSCTSVPVEDLIREADENRALFFDGGGVTVTGGEPTMQFDGLKELLTGLKAIGIHTAVETNGNNPRLAELFPVIDQLILDCKHVDSEIHKEITGVPNEIIRDNIRAALKDHPNVLIRTPLISSFNAEAEILERFVAFFQECGTENAKFELLKYHEYGREKWISCGIPYTMKKGYISDSLYGSLEEIYKNAGLTVVRS